MRGLALPHVYRFVLRLKHGRLRTHLGLSDYQAVDIVCCIATSHRIEISRPDFIKL